MQDDTGGDGVKLKELHTRSAYELIMCFFVFLDTNEHNSLQERKEIQVDEIMIAFQNPPAARAGVPFVSLKRIFFEQLMKRISLINLLHLIGLYIFHSCWVLVRNTCLFFGSKQT